MTPTTHSFASWTMFSEFGQEKSILAEISSILTHRLWDSARIEEVVTAVGEACLNALEHGNLLCKEKPVKIHMVNEPHSCSFRIYDQGNGFVYSPPLPPDADSLTRVYEVNQDDSTRGWGLMFISSFADKVQVIIEPGECCMEIHFQHHTWERGDS